MSRVFVSRLKTPQFARVLVTVLRASLPMAIAVSCTRGGEGGNERGGAGGSAATSGGGSAEVAGFNSCRSDRLCSDQLQSWLGFFETPRPPLGSRQLLGSSCVQVAQECPHSTVCACSFKMKDDTSDCIVPSYIVLGADFQCDAGGSLGSCLAPASDFAGCDPSVPGACETRCASILAAIDADAAQVYQTQVRFAACVNSECRGVVQIGDNCYAGRPLTPPHTGFSLPDTSNPYSCALTDEEILAQALANPSPSATTRFSCLPILDAGAGCPVPALQRDF
jgi:hypothetical protein